MKNFLKIGIATLLIVCLFAATNQAYANNLLTNIAAYYLFSGNSNDATGNGVNGTDTSMTYSGTCGIIGNGACFNGTTGGINETGGALLPSMSTGSMSFWFKTSSASNQNFAGFACAATPSGCVYNFGINGGTVTMYGLNSPAATYANGNWHQVVMTWTGSAGTLYIDGSSVNTNAGFTWSASQYLYIGGINTGAGWTQMMNGSMDEMGLWTRVLTAAEVTSLYNSGAGFQYPFSSAVTSSPKGTIMLMAMPY
jgi:hypothetical protein